MLNIGRLIFPMGITSLKADSLITIDSMTGGDQAATPPHRS